MRTQPFQILMKIWNRVSGIEPRKLYNQLTDTQNQLTDTQNQLTDTQNQLTDTQNQLTDTQNQLTDTQNQLTDTQNQRSKRIHPFIFEALELVTSNENVLKKDSVEENKYSAFTEFGSDKDTRHSYGTLYLELLGKFASPRILEIGVGSVNDFPYAGLQPAGGALKAFRKEFQNALIIGIDIDPHSIETIKEQGFIGFVADQNSDESLINTKKILTEKGPFDLIIDDGFHDPHANIRTLKIIFDLLSENGTYVIEDVHETLIPFWNAIAIHLPGNVRILDLRKVRPETDDNILILITKN